MVPPPENSPSPRENTTEKRWRAECRKSKERTLPIPEKEVAKEEVEVAETVTEAVTEEVEKVQIHFSLQDEKITQKIDSR